MAAKNSILLAKAEAAAKASPFAKLLLQQAGLPLKPVATTAAVVALLHDRCGAYVETVALEEALKPGHVLLYVVLRPEQKQQAVNVRKLIEEVLHDSCPAGVTFTIGVT